MSDIRTIFEEVSADQPPSSITRETAIGAGRQRQRRRRGLFAVAGLAAVVAITPIAISALAQGTGPAPLPVGAPSSSAAPATETPPQIAARLTTALQAAAAAVRPDAQFATDPNYRPGLAPPALAVLPPGSVADLPDLDWYEGFALVTTGAGQGNLSVRFTLDGAKAGLGAAPCTAYTTDRSSCAPQTGPHGEQFSVWTSSKTDGFQEVGVTVHLADGSAVSAVATNSAGGPYLPAPIFTTEQLTALVTSAGMTITQ
ncbi:hypothetical protein F4553_006198 [Allocatelliglobosispora scoriae]|uniref:Uncharacterized protein n=1 Tax=Allocatelliglobosispora scoriae TaxID=643052 RepID=A0A841BX83_9ACTN|nr:hypothetical protein [Allocatelliglobosispora scoriae]MBB5872764.1 hypothetical protein [Allocatelliglobosispora scoriae]